MFFFKVYAKNPSLAVEARKYLRNALKHSDPEYQILCGSHVGHEGDGAGAPDGVHHVDDHHGELGGQRLGDDVAAGGPREHLDTGSIL